ncbi:MAG: hypothetical protein GWM98_24210, partial [Nitrospinaceae bacterium]|nr:hypothetical protein [Nitrospinaceae bacterium]NIR56997.1 hypothetical protein [Nitrospinaceae bacterium]NIS87454.1 hypothetical protein [Nitrospinaceae bacterium]NIT84303.1 hypothetical protein [Nitrospinaceae bacterium]NIU46493.1 hypothetical protein [Nitrospinaceae bacterium]
IPNSVTAAQKEVGFISLSGKPVRPELEQSLNRNLETKTIAFVYLGVFDSSRVQWRQLAEMRDTVFLTRDPIREEMAADNLVVLDERFSFPDLIASADVVVTKAGYSTLATAFNHGKPVLSCEREDFSEYRAMKRFMEEQKVGRIISSEEFFAGQWAGELEQTLKLDVRGKVRLNGAEEVAGIIGRYLDS